MTHNIPLGTHISFGASQGSRVFEVASYQTLLGPCQPNCVHDHDCYTEPYITVRTIEYTAYPLRTIEYIYDSPDGYGRKPTPQDLGV